MVGAFNIYIVSEDLYTQISPTRLFVLILIVYPQGILQIMISNSPPIVKEIRGHLGKNISSILQRHAISAQQKPEFELVGGFNTVGISEGLEKV